MLTKLTGTVVRGAFLFLSTALLIESYQIPEDTIPEQILLGARLIFGGILLVSLFSLAHQYLYLTALRWHRSRRYQWPAVNNNKPDPNQWLLDQAERQRDNPSSHLVITDRRIMSFSRNAKRPTLNIQVLFENLGVHELLIGKPVGSPFYAGERLDRIEDTGGWNIVPAPGGIIRFDLDIRIPPEFFEAVCKELDTFPGEIRDLRLNLDAKVWVKGDESKESRLGLGAEPTVFKPNW